MTQRSRRHALTLLLGCLVTPGLATAQRRRDPPKLGALWAADAPTAVPYLAAFKDSLQELGWVDGRTIQIIVRYDDGVAARRPEIAAEVVALRVDVLFSFNALLPAVRRITTTIPIVCGDFFDPIAEGLTTSMARPDGNVTGVSWQSPEVAGKRVQFARELRPRARRIGVLADSGDAGAAIELRGTVAAAREAGVTLEKLELRSMEDIEPTLAKLQGARIDVLIVQASTLTWPVIGRIVDAATTAGIPIVSEPEEFAAAGAVVTYGVDVFAALRRCAVFVDRILKGATPRDLPIEQITKFDFVVNLKSAKILGLPIPASLMERATKIIR